MKTDDLARVLAEDLRPVRARPFAGPILPAGLGGAVVSAIILIVWLGLRPLGAAAHSGPFWMKAAYTLALSSTGFAMATRLARPGGRIGGAGAPALLAIAWLAVLAGLETSRTAPTQLASLWLGQTWTECSFRIVALAAPVYLATLWVMRRMAPTRLGLAGAAAGLLAGSVGATVYGLYCEETTAAFVVVWYTLGVGCATALGALVGIRLLRW